MDKSKEKMANFVDDTEILLEVVALFKDNLNKMDEHSINGLDYELTKMIIETRFYLYEILKKRKFNEKNSKKSLTPKVNKKPEIKVGQVWFNDELDEIFLIYNEIFISYMSLLKIDYYNFKNDNWHYVGEL